MSSCFFLFFFVCVFVCVSHPTYGYGYMNLSHTRPILTKCDHTKSIQANLNQTKLKQTKKDHTNVTKIQASPLLSVCPILSTYKLTFPNRTHKLDQTKITINGFGMAKRAAQLLYGPVLVCLWKYEQNWPNKFWQNQTNQIKLKPNQTKLKQMKLK